MFWMCLADSLECGRTNLCSTGSGNALFIGKIFQGYASNVMTDNSRPFAFWEGIDQGIGEIDPFFAERFIFRRRL